MMDLQVIGLVAAADVFAVFFAAVLYLFYYFELLESIHL